VSPSLRHRDAARPDQVGAGGTASADAAAAQQRREAIGWFRGIASGLAILVVGLAVSVGASNEILTNVSGMSRDNLAYLASAVFLVVLVVAAWAIRRLQARGMI
jgi:hypothetical protein